MKKSLVKALVLAGLAVGVLQFYTTQIMQPVSIAAPVAQAGDNYKPRLVKNVIVKNYNAVGEKETLYTHMPQRVVAVGEQINETLVALGVEDKVICAVRYGNPFYTPEPEYADRYNKIKFENFVVMNAESLVAMRADLIVSGQSLFTDKRLKSTEFWNERGVYTYLPPNANSPSSRVHRESLDDELGFILGLGTIFDKEARAKAIVQDMYDTIEYYKQRSHGMPKPKVMIIEGLGKQKVAYDETKLAGDICTRLGAYVPSSPLGTISIEAIIDEDPDVIFMVKSGGDPEAAAEAFRTTPALRSLKAVRNNRVHGIALNYTYNSAIKTGEGIKKFARGIYPDIPEMQKS
ncbi:MAG: ABC transporter substrate-binding protein [Phascolarctobacterium sp.]